MGCGASQLASDPNSSEASALYNRNTTEARKVFTLFDKEQSGTIYTAQLAMALRALGFNPTSGELKNMIQLVDPAGTGQLDFDAFCVAWNNADTLMGKEDLEEEMYQVFSLLDRDRDGYITTSELMRMFRTKGISTTARLASWQEQLKFNVEEHKLDFVQFLQLLMPSAPVVSPPGSTNSQPPSRAASRRTSLQSSPNTVTPFELNPLPASQPVPPITDVDGPFKRQSEIPCAGQQR